MNQPISWPSYSNLLVGLHTLLIDGMQFGGVCMPRITLFSASTGINIVIAYVFALLFLYLLARMLLGPHRSTGKLLARAGLTTFSIVLLNVIGGLVGFRIPLNLVTVLVPTFLGLPGFALVALLQYLLF